MLTANISLYKDLYEARAVSQFQDLLGFAGRNEFSIHFLSIIFYWKFTALENDGVLISQDVAMDLQTSTDILKYLVDKCPIMGPLTYKLFELLHWLSKPYGLVVIHSR